MKLLVTGASGFIGTNFIDFYSTKDCTLVNIDMKMPFKKEHNKYWQRVDITDSVDVDSVFAEFRPTHVVHMAARTDCDEDTTVEEGYAVNTVGTKNVLSAIRNTRSIDRAIVVSTQYVAGPSRLPEHDQDYFPHTIYGESKVVTEQLVRAADLGCSWTIVRPTNIWGPWHMRYRREAWKVIKKGLYVHPGRKPVVRSYGYVGNVVWQMAQIMDAPEVLVDQHVFYVGDRPDDIYKWVNAFSLALTGRSAKRIPRSVVASIGWIGDLLGKYGKAFPLTSSRFQNMTSDYLVPVDKTFEVFGDPPYSLQHAVDETITWLELVGWD